MDWNVQWPWRTCLAYHGIAQGQSSDNVKKTTGAITVS